jgi:hypothetical protein
MINSGHKNKQNHFNQFFHLTVKHLKQFAGCLSKINKTGSKIPTKMAPNDGEQGFRIFLSAIYYGNRGLAANFRAKMTHLWHYNECRSTSLVEGTTKFRRKVSEHPQNAATIDSKLNQTPLRTCDSTNAKIGIVIIDIDKP